MRQDWVFGSSIPIDTTASSRWTNWHSTGQYSRVGNRCEAGTPTCVDHTRAYRGLTQEAGVRFVAQWLSGGKLARPISHGGRRSWRFAGLPVWRREHTTRQPGRTEFIGITRRTEAGFRAGGTALTLFHTLRVDQQVIPANRTPKIQTRSFFTDCLPGASTGSWSKLQVELHLFGALGYLKSHVTATRFRPIGPRREGIGRRPTGTYTFSLGSACRHP